MSSQTETILSSLYSILNMTISVIIGFILSKMNVLTPVTRKIVSDINYYSFVPIYCLVFIMQAIDRNRLSELFLLFASNIPALVIGLLITYLATWIFNFDIRMRFSYIFINACGNFAVISQILGAAFCDKGGKFENTPQCKAGLVNAYSSVAMIYINIFYWAAVLPIIQKEKQISREIQKIYLIVLNYYSTINDFMSDTKFAKSKQINLAKNNSIELISTQRNSEEPSVLNNITNNHESSTIEKIPKMTKPLKNRPKYIQSTQIDLETPPDELVTLENPRFLKEYYDKEVSRAFYLNLIEHYNNFRQVIYYNKDNEPVRAEIKKTILIPYQLDKMIEIEPVFSWTFVKNRILTAPPSICSIIGLILGFIFPVKEFLFDPANKPIPMFLNTLKTVGGMMMPISMYLLGTYLAQSATISQQMFIRWKHVIISNVIKNLIMPCIGLFWILYVVRQLSQEEFRNNPILVTINFIQWIVPNGLVLIAVYVVADYFAKEFAVLSIYLNLVSVIMMSAFLVTFFYLYDNMIQT